ncbi:MAG: MFS transporter [Halobacteriales archaeon]
MADRRLVLGLCVLAYFGTRLGQLVISPLVPDIRAAFGVSTGAVGAALSGMWAAYALVQFPAGTLGDRFGERSVVLVALASAAAASLLLAGAPTFPAFLAVLVAFGAGVGLYYNVATALLAREFEGVGRAIGVHRVGGVTAGLVAPVAVTAVSLRAGWRSGLLLGAAVAAPVLVAFRWGVPSTPPTRPGAALRDRFDAALAADLLSRPSLAYPTALATLGEFVGQATVSFLPAFLVGARGLPLPRAGLLFSIYFLALGIAQPLSGWLSDRIGRDAATGAAVLLGAVGYALLAAGPADLLAAGVVLAGYSRSWSAPIQARVMDHLPAAERGAGFGLVRTVYVLLGALGSVVTGALVDAAGWRPAFGLLGGLLALAALAIVLVGAGRLLRDARSRRNG